MRILLLVVLVSGCAEETIGQARQIEPGGSDATISYIWRADCPGTPEDREQALAGFKLWEQFGETFAEAPGGVEICFHETLWWGQRLGAVSWEGEHTYLDLISWTEWVHGIAAHEIGHVILGNGHHLPPAVYGIMSGEALNGGFFTEDDLKFLHDEGYL